MCHQRNSRILIKSYMAHITEMDILLVCDMRYFNSKYGMSDADNYFLVDSQEDKS